MIPQKRFSTIFKVIYYAFIIFSFIGGITAGAVFRKGIFDGFNWEMMFYVWLSGGVIELILYATYAHLENQAVQIELLSSINDKLNPPKTNVSSTKTEHKPIPPKKSITPTKPVHHVSSSQWLCSNCGLRNSTANSLCRGCGAEK